MGIDQDPAATPEMIAAMINGGHEAGYSLDMANRYFSMAWAARNIDGDGAMWFGKAMAELFNAMDALELDLVPRLTPQQAHEAMIAKRRAEDADDPVSDTERDLKQARANEERDFSVIGGGRV